MHTNRTVICICSQSCKALHWIDVTVRAIWLESLQNDQNCCWWIEIYKVSQSCGWTMSYKNLLALYVQSRSSAYTQQEHLRPRQWIVQFQNSLRGHPESQLHSNNSVQSDTRKSLGSVTQLSKVLWHIISRLIDTITTFLGSATFHWYSHRHWVTLFEKLGVAISRNLCFK